MEETMRRRLALLAALSLALVLPASASAGRATHLADHRVNLTCDGVHPTSGTGFAFFDVSFSEINQFGTILDTWNSDQPDDNPPDVSRDYLQPETIAWDGTTLSGSFPLVSDGVTVGSASYSATFSPVGDPFPINDSGGLGNHKNQTTGTGQPLQPAGLLVLSTGPTFDLAACVAEADTVTVFTTNPASLVFGFASRNVGCDLTDAAGDIGSLFVDLSTNDAFIDATVFPTDPASPAIDASGFGTIAHGTLDASLDAILMDTGEPAGVPASIHMTVTSTGEKFRLLMKAATSRRVTSGTLFDVTGTLTIGTYSFDLGACIGQAVRIKDISTFPHGPKPGGKVPANDLPSGAKLLAIGGSDFLSTRGASPNAEAPYECLTFEDPPGVINAVPVGSTVWYRIIGTGSPVTIDTAGSDFDTVMAVYTSDGAGGFTPVPDSCVDDVPVLPFGRTLQAAVTIPTEVGTSYYVQIGGYPELLTYGNLRVSVR
jgi:hypothetical protein